MKIWPQILNAFIIIAIAITGSFLLQRHTSTGIDKQYVDSLMNVNRIVIDLDSVQSAIESQIYDSLNKSINSLQGEIKNLKTQNYLLRKSNEELEKKYRSIVVDLPEL